MTGEGLRQYKDLFRIAFIATISMLIIIPLQIIVFSLTKIPDTTIGWFLLFLDNPLVGFFHADFFILADNILIAVIYLAFYQTLKETNKGLMQIALVLGLIGISAYISSNKTFELMSLANQYSNETNEAKRAILEAAGKSALGEWQGTGFDAYYVLNGITLVIISLSMLKSALYSKATAIWGLMAAIFMIIPSTAGRIGLIFSLLSLIPWYIFSVKIAMVLKSLTTSPASKGYIE